MGMTVQGTPANTALTSLDTTHVLTLPSGIQAGEKLFIAVEATEETIGSPSISGWDLTAFADIGNSDGISLGLFTKTATGSEGATVSMTTGAAVTVVATAWRATGVDTTSPLDSPANYGANFETDENPFTLPANTLTNVDAGNEVLLMWGAQASRSLTSLDGALTLIGSGIAAAGASLFVAFGSPSGTGNPAYSITMSDTRQWGWLIAELKASGGGGGGSLSLGGMQPYMMTVVRPGPVLTIYG